MISLKEDGSLSKRSGRGLFWTVIIVLSAAFGALFFLFR